MKLLLEDVARALGVECPVRAEVSGWSTDSRSIAAGDFFFPLRGPNHDGHDHLAQAFERGAVAAVVDREYAGQGLVFRVADTLRALQDVASFVRDRWGGEVVGVTGSAGKTSTKEIVARLLAGGGGIATGKTEGNFNNHVGLPLSILRLPGDAQVAVLELGMNHQGEIRDLARIAKPRIGVVTNVGYAHIENFDSIEGIAAAKRELVEALPAASGLAVLNADDPRVARFGGPRVVSFGIDHDATFRAREVEYVETGGVRFQVDGVPFESAVAGRHNVLNILAGVAVGREYGVGLKALAEAARELPALKMRGERMERNGVIVWNDCYNANPDAMRAMIDVLRDTRAARRIAVLGEMRELGSWSRQLHAEVGQYAGERGINIVVGVVGDAASMVDAAKQAGAAGYFAADPETAGDLLKELARPGDAILFKGSRGTKVERALERYLA